MALSLSECEAVVEELQPSLVGARIQKIHQPQADTLTFDIRFPGETLVLLICAEPRFGRLHFATRKFENPPTPPPFCQFLRAHVEGGRIEEIVQEPGDRIVSLTMTTAVGRYVLVVALTGNQSNVYLLNDSKNVMQCLRPSWVKIGDTYTAPTRARHLDSLTRPLHKQEGERETKRGGNSGSHPSSPPSPQRGEGVTAEEKTTKFSMRFPVSAELEERYWQQEQDLHLSQLRHAQVARVKKALKQVNRKIKGLQEDLEKAERYRGYGRYGELLKGQLHSLTKGQASATVIDYYDPSLPQLTLALDSSKDPVWNMENYFRKHHKFLSAEKHLRPRLETAKKEAIQLQEELTKFESGDVPPMQPNSLHPPETRPGRQRSTTDRKKLQPTRATGYREYVSFDGLPLLVGKTARDNDALTFKVARPDDLWLHARGTPGSHVVIRLDQGAQVPHETLRDAATLALWFSDLRKSRKGEVIYTRRKFVKKTKGQKAGTVTVSREKTIWIEVRDERLERLKGKT